MENAKTNQHPASVSVSDRRAAHAPHTDPRHGGATAPTVDQLRTYLSHLHRPHRLDTPQMRALLARHGRLPTSASSATVGAAAARLLTDKIAALKAPPDAPATERLPHRVLETCFVRRRKLYQAAPELGLSERQLSRERARALELLAAELAAPDTALWPEPIPSVESHIRRETLVQRLTYAASADRLVAVTGPQGVGKTSLVATLAQSLGREHVWWLRVRRGLNDSLEALLLELGGALARDGHGELRTYLTAALPHPSMMMATRLFLDALPRRRRLVVLDDFDAAREPDVIASFLHEAVDRVTQLCVVTIGRSLHGAAVVEVPPLSGPETAQVFRAEGLSLPSYMLDALHELGGGRVGVIAACAKWWSGRPGGLGQLQQQVARQHPVEVLARLIRFEGGAA